MGQLRDLQHVYFPEMMLQAAEYYLRGQSLEISFLRRTSPAFLTAQPKAPAVHPTA